MVLAGFEPRWPILGALPIVNDLLIIAFPLRA
jgi:hypothetical protein